MFRLDERGCLTGDDPLLYVVRTPDAVICACHAGLPPACIDALTSIAARPRGRPRAWAGDYAEYLSTLGAFATIDAVRAGPLFGFPDDLGPDDEACVRIGPWNVHLLEGGLDEWIGDVATGRPMVAALTDGRAGAICGSVFASGAVHGAGVKSAAAHRRRGLGRRAVAGWARLVRLLGAEPLYATTFDNVPSQKLAQRLGLELIGSEFSASADAGSVNAS